MAADANCVVLRAYLTTIVCGVTVSNIVRLVEGDASELQSLLVEPPGASALKGVRSGTAAVF